MSEYKRSGGFGGRGSKGGFNRGGRPNFGGKPGFRNFGNRGEYQQMFQAVCASCGKTCEVPFRPTGEKPVYCSNCFRSNKNTQSDNYNQRDNRQRENYSDKNARKQPSDELKKQLEQFNVKLDKIISLLSDKTPTEPLKAIVEKAMASPLEKKKKTAKKKIATKKKV